MGIAAGICLTIALHAVAVAETAGVVVGTVTDDRTHAPLAGVAVVAKSPSATYRETTDAQGRFRFLSVLPDNYSLSFSRSDYAPYSTA
ncbi:MAG: carboxypeptidase regulatory-like domain-containing protein, partial [Candidatus Eremiobacteraeota bacterium]|nr:carboxypeptidase regulatory-like domain-containing protein [Candidatus Eremiobacteraeota bacterium]